MQEDEGKITKTLIDQYRKDIEYVFAQLIKLIGIELTRQFISEISEQILYNRRRSLPGLHPPRDSEPRTYEEFRDRNRRAAMRAATRRLGSVDEARDPAISTTTTRRDGGLRVSEMTRLAESLGVGVGVGMVDAPEAEPRPAREQMPTGNDGEEITNGGAGFYNLEYRGRPAPWMMSSDINSIPEGSQPETRTRTFVMTPDGETHPIDDITVPPTPDSESIAPLLREAERTNHG